MTRIVETLARFRIPLIIAVAIWLAGWVYGCEVRRHAELSGELKAKAVAIDSAIKTDVRAVVTADAHAAPIVAKQVATSARYAKYRAALALKVPHVEALPPEQLVAVPVAFVLAADEAVAAADSAREADATRIAARDASITDLNARLVVDAEEVANARRISRLKTLKVGAVCVGAGALLTLILTK